MAISINWVTQVITIPKADLTLIQASPEVRELDVNAFRLNLKDIEDNAEGMTFLDTHRHNTEVLLGGLVYARVFEIINGYTVEFEDDQYTVNCVGANHNLADVKVANQVSLIVNNSAGLIVNTGSVITPTDITNITDAVWGETPVGYTVDGTYGKLINDMDAALSQLKTLAYLKLNP